MEITVRLKAGLSVVAAVMLFAMGCSPASQAPMAQQTTAEDRAAADQTDTENLGSSGSAAGSRQSLMEQYTGSAILSQPSPAVPNYAIPQTAIPHIGSSFASSGHSPGNSWATSPEDASIPANLLRSTPMPVLPPDSAGAHLNKLPAGAQRNSQQGFATVRVFYATDRQRGELSLANYQIEGQKQNFLTLCAIAASLIAFTFLSLLLKRERMAMVCAVAGGGVGCLAGALLYFGEANIEKHGVVYNGARGELMRGICDVTVPDSHRRGQVERPSLLRFEFREDQQEHIVLTSAVELTDAEFAKKLAHTVGQSPQGDLLVFIHGYNVKFEDAVQRTAQIAVDLPFEGVPVCYSWPSQGSLLGYSIDENNSEWTIPHLKQFLLELVRDSGAKSINVVAHSMGNRVMTAAMQQINQGLAADSPPPFDRIVLAAPDVDADRFRRDLAPALLNVSQQVTLYASSSDQALIASKKVHGYPRAGEGGANIVIVPGIETIDVSGIDLSLLGHSYYADSQSLLRDLFGVVRARLFAPQRQSLVSRQSGNSVYWELADQHGTANARQPNHLR